MAYLRYRQLEIAFNNSHAGERWVEADIIPKTSAWNAKKMPRLKSIRDYTMVQEHLERYWVDILTETNNSYLLLHTNQLSDLPASLTSVI